MSYITMDIFDRLCAEKGAKYIENLKNPVIINGNITTMFFLFKGTVMECIIDTEDLQKISLGKTWLGKNCATNKRVRIFCYHNKSHLFLHHCIIPKVDGKVVDHINRDNLDNRKCNLRSVTQGENMLNKKDYDNHKVQRLIIKHRDGYRVFIQRYFKDLSLAEEARDEILKIMDRYSEQDAISR